MKTQIELQYVDVKKQWRKIGPIARSECGRRIWFPEMLEYRAIRQLLCLKDLGSLDYGCDHHNAKAPCDFDSLDWRFNNRGRGRRPGFWDYVCWDACHWLVNLNLFLASTTLPQHPWQIVTSEQHSTVWNGHNLLFDMNFLALDVSVGEAWILAAEDKESDILEVGERRELEPWSTVVQDLKDGNITEDEALELRFGKS